MGVVHLYLPVVSHAAHVGMLNTELDNRIDETVDQVDLIGLVHTLSDI